MSLSSAQLICFSQHLHAVLGEFSETGEMTEVAAGFADAFQAIGMPIDRIQLPLSYMFGLKHPLYVGIILTWTSDGGSRAWLRRREDLEKDANQPFATSPFAVLRDAPDSVVRMDAGTEEWARFPLLRDLEGQGYKQYLAVAVPLPDGATQVISIATRRPDGFGDACPGLLKVLSPFIAIALHGIYQNSSANQIARTYLGAETGKRVLQGAIARGETESILAAIAFVDVRDFTRMSAKLGANGIIPLLNETFDAISTAIRPAGGEILKFMGDAALIVFRRDTEVLVPCIDIVSCLLDAITEVETRTEAAGERLRIGVGLHIGEVVYGNIGSCDRLDFTVMGPAVNLASRLEPLTKTFGLPIVLSNEFATMCQGACATPVEASERLRTRLHTCGKVELKGIAEPVAVWGVEARTESSTFASQVAHGTSTAL